MAAATSEDSIAGLSEPVLSVCSRWSRGKRKGGYSVFSGTGLTRLELPSSGDGVQDTVVIELEMEDIIVLGYKSSVI